MERTPEFVAWTLSQACALREDSDTTDPLSTERQLRVLRSYADAVAENRCQAGICINAEQERGFRLTDVLSAYGGEKLIASQCGTCPANTLRNRPQGNFAGCFGWLILTDEHREELSQIHARYHTLWLDSTPDADTLEEHARLFQKLTERFPDSAAYYDEYQQAIRLALASGCSLHWQFVPAGSTDGITWTIHAHCPRCRAAMAVDARYCRVCEYHGHPEPARKRKARGQRPYTPLTKFLGEAGAAEFLRRYRVSRGEVE